MIPNTSKEQEMLQAFEAAMASSIPVHAKWRRKITRADGTIDDLIIPTNIVTKDGLNAIAACAFNQGTGVSSPAFYLAIGTVTAAPSLGSTVLLFGEVSRKTPSIRTTSKMTMIMAMTWAGNTDALTGVPLGSGGMVNHASSGAGTIYNITNSINTTLQASDFLYLECDISIGSHNL